MIPYLSFIDIPILSLYPSPFPSHSICVWVREVCVGEERLGKESSVVLQLIPDFHTHFLLLPSTLSADVQFRVCLLILGSPLQPITVCLFHLLTYSHLLSDSHKFLDIQPVSPSLPCFHLSLYILIYQIYVDRKTLWMRNDALQVLNIFHQVLEFLLISCFYFSSLKMIMYVFNKILK